MRVAAGFVGEFLTNSVGAQCKGNPYRFEVVS